MRKMYAAAAFCAVAFVAVAAASGAVAQGPLKVHGKTSVFPTPVNTLDSKGKAHTTSTEVTPAGSFVQSVTVTSTRNGSFTATLPFDKTGLTSKANGTAVTLSATATQVTRRDKDTGDKVKCLEASGINDFTAAV